MPSLTVIQKAQQSQKILKQVKYVLDVDVDQMVKCTSDSASFTKHLPHPGVWVDFTLFPENYSNILSHTDHGLDAVLPWSWFWLPKKVLVSVMTWCHHFAFFVLLFHLLPSTTKRASSNHQGKTKDWKLETLSQSHAMLLTTASQTRCILAQRVSKTLPLYTLFWTKEHSFIVRCHCTPVLTIIPHKWKQAFSSLQTHVRTVKMAARTDHYLKVIKLLRLSATISTAEQLLC